MPCFLIPLHELSEVNHCHGKGSKGHPCTGGAADPPAHVDAEGVTHVGAFVELYHGTSRRRANVITKQGLRVGAVRQQTMQGDPESSRLYVWLAKKAGSAKGYAEMHVNPVVITFRIPEAVYAQFSSRDSGPDSVWIKDTIPAKYIHSIDRAVF